MGRHDLFLSYSSKDKPTADAVCAILERNGVRCWIAPRDIVPGEDWAEAIIGAIYEAKVFVLLFSSFSNASPQIKREVERAANRGLPILPFRTDETPPNPTLEFFISTPHWLDALTPPLEQHAERLAQTVKRLIAPVGEAEPDDDERPKPAPPPPAPPEPTPTPPPSLEAAARKVPPLWQIIACVMLAILAIRLIPWRKSDPPDPPKPSDVSNTVASEKPVVADKPAPPAPPETATPAEPAGHAVAFIEANPGAFYTPVDSMVRATTTSAELRLKFKPYGFSAEANPAGGYRIRATGFGSMLTAIVFCGEFEKVGDYQVHLKCTPEQMPAAPGNGR